MLLETLDSHYIQSFKTIAQKLFILAKAKDRPASVQLASPSDLT